MRLTATTLGLACVVAAVGTGCGVGGPKGPTREAVTPLLQQEADALKRDGEKMDPVLRVTATWTVAGIDVKQRPNDSEKPWAGTIRFKIRSETKNERGQVDVDEFERHFDYVYSTVIKRWIFQYQPSPAPAPAP
jgi:hypothetical protein